MIGIIASIVGGFIALAVLFWPSWSKYGEKRSGVIVLLVFGFLIFALLVGWARL